MTRAKVELNDVMGDAMNTALANTHTILVAKIVAVNETTIDVRPVVQRVVDGEGVDLPVFPAVPPIFLQGGETYDAHPITEGDYCLLLVSERSFDRWYDGADNVPPVEQRMHDYSDCFALVGVNPKATARIITAFIERIGDSHVVGEYQHEGSYDLTGALTVTGSTDTTGNTDSTTYSVNGTPGWSGVFRTGDSRNVTVVSGLITNVA